MDFDLPMDWMVMDMPIVLDDGAYAPVREHDDDAGMDLRTPKDFILFAHGSIVIDTGVHIAIPKGYYGRLESKSGLHIRHDIVCLGGTIDCGYTGSIRVKLYNFGNKDYEFSAGDKLTQLVILPYIAPRLVLTAKLEETERSDNGFGSTGK